MDSGPVYPSPFPMTTLISSRAVGGSKNLRGVSTNVMAIICQGGALVEIGLTDLPKSGGAMACTRTIRVVKFSSRVLKVRKIFA